MNEVDIPSLNLNLSMMLDRVNIPRTKYYEAIAWLDYYNYEYFTIPGPPWANWKKVDNDEIGFVFYNKEVQLLFILKWA